MDLMTQTLARQMAIAAMEGHDDYCCEQINCSDVNKADYGRLVIPANDSDDVAVYDKNGYWHIVAQMDGAHYLVTLVMFKWTFAAFSRERGELAFWTILAHGCEDAWTGAKESMQGSGYEVIHVQEAEQMAVEIQELALARSDFIVCRKGVTNE